MVTKLRRDGDQWVIPVAAEVIAALGIDEETEVDVAEVADGLLVTLGSSEIGEVPDNLRELVEEGLAAVERGEVLSHEEVFGELRRRMASRSDQ